MVLNGLKVLYGSMRSQRVDRVRFQYVLGPVSFDVFFLIDEKPFCLLFGAVKHNLVFEFAVTPGFQVAPVIPSDEFYKLCRALGLKHDPLNPFRMTAFLTAFDSKIPANAPSKSSPELIAKYRRDVEESEKKYFLRWSDNKVKNTNVTVLNLEKTKRILGEAAYLSCEKRNISSCWTDDESKRVTPSAVP